MIICPMDYTIAWLCSLLKNIPPNIKSIVQEYVIITSIMCYLYNQICFKWLMTSLFSAMNFCNVLGGKSTSSSHNF